MRQDDFKIGDKVLLKGTGGTYCKEVALQLLEMANVNPDNCYNWTEDMPTSLLNKINKEGVIVTIKYIGDCKLFERYKTVYLIEYENGMYSILSNIYGEMHPYTTRKKGVIKYRIKDNETYVNTSEGVVTVAKRNPKDVRDDNKGILIAVARALVSEETVQKIIDVLFEDYYKNLNSLSNYSTQELLAEISKRVD